MSKIVEESEQSRYKWKIVSAGKHKQLGVDTKHTASLTTNYPEPVIKNWSLYQLAIGIGQHPKKLIRISKIHALEKGRHQ